MKYIVIIEKFLEDRVLKEILVWNHHTEDYIEVVMHYISYKEYEKRGIGKWKIKQKNV